MTVKVLVYIRNSNNNTISNFSCEFARIPTVGEHIWLAPDEGYYINNEDCLKVVYVAHMAFVEGLSDHRLKFSAFVYAIKESHQEAINASGFFQ
ncbi:hypothetical protein QUB60_12035 [Microcoleus sp. A2-C5]|uniref:hypothetical protein n=1 Tax=unclassified Microcoleus TaxID=2642155 RepID=UPI002FD1AE2D